MRIAGVPIAGWVALVMATAPSGAVSGQEVRARAVDEQTRLPVAAATALLLDGARTVATASTDADGFFRLRAPGPGEYMVAVLQPGYAQGTRDVTVGADTTLAAFVLRPEAIVLDSIGVAARRRRPTSFEAGFIRPSYVISGDRIRRMEAMGADMYTAIREISGIRSQEYQTPGGRHVTCLETVRLAPTLIAVASPGSIHCPRHIVVVLDGMVVPGAEDMLRTIPLSHLESVTYFPPAEAGFRYGLEGSAFGALVLWTRGRGPFTSDERNRR